MAFLLCSCSDSKTLSQDDESRQTTLELLLQMPDNSQSTRISDPGNDTQETADWNQLTLFFVYTDDTAPSGGNAVVPVILTKEQYDRLGKYSDDSDIRLFSIRLPKGKVYIYGVTTSTDAKNAPDFSTVTSKDDIDALTVSNSYAEGDANSMDKFLSVATGFFRNPQHPSQQGTVDLEKLEESTTSPYTIPLLTLTRLATKIDVQWDAQDAYSDGYTDVKVTDFAYFGGTDESSSDKGSGCLFPSLCPDDKKPSNGTYAFANSQEISKRNGREYFLLFPNGIVPTSTNTLDSPHINFTITSVKNNYDGTTTGNTRKYTFKIAQQLQPAFWYKINTTVKGNSATTDVVKHVFTTGN